MRLIEPGRAVMPSNSLPIACQNGSERPPVYTIGHSTRTIPEFVELLQIGNVELVVDIRSVPRSRTNPQFNLDVLSGQLASSQIKYTQIRELGGLRSKSKTIPADVNGFWTNLSFHNYADYALSDAFHLGLSQLVALSQERRCAMMCSEAVWWRCHRRIVADYLIHGGRTVFHLMGPARAEPATLTKAATADGDALVYPAG
jgi:uncharacterized protein (DUF488 family)